MRVKIGGDTEKSGNKTHLLVIMCVMLSQKIGLIDLTNRTLFKKKKQLLTTYKSVCNNCRFFNILHTLSYYYAHKNIDLLEVCDVITAQKFALYSYKK